MSSELDQVMAQKAARVSGGQLAAAFLVVLAVVALFFVAPSAGPGRHPGGMPTPQGKAPAPVKAEEPPPMPTPASQPSPGQQPGARADGTGHPEGQPTPGKRPGRPGGEPMPDKGPAPQDRSNPEDVNPREASKPAAATSPKANPPPVKQMVSTPSLWWGSLLMALLLLAVGYLSYRGVLWLTQRWPRMTAFGLARQYRYIRANQAQLASAAEFPRVKAAWLDLLAHHGLPRQPAETLVQQALRQPARWAPVRESVLVFARACDAETYGGAPLSQASRADAIKLYLALYERLPELAKPNSR